MNPARKLVPLAAALITMDSSGPCPRWTRRSANVAGLVGLAVACLLPAGCGTTRTPPSAQTTPADEQAAEGDAASSSPDATAIASSTATSAGQAGTPSGREASTAASAPDQRSNGMSEPLVLAPVGPEDARRGKSITGGGIISEPLRQHFLIQHRIVFEIQLKQAQRLYNAEHGRMPQSHDEYMTEIVEKNQIQLPELDGGWDYYYDATDETLKQRQVQ